ncbi:MAG TPA: ATP F0F1 synthase subunit B [Salinarimonas sp.]|nr:ATP F0F1 synthase subunit B [Salinarimonas sp.]
MLSNPTFWVGVSFVLFFAILAYYGVHRTVAASLDARSTRIADELAEARRLREDAEALLREFATKRAAAESEAAAIVTAAREEAERMNRDAQERTTEFVRRRTAAAEAKIAQAETQAMAEVRAAAADAAVRAAETVLRAELRGPAGEELLTRSLGDVRRKLNG